ncbi:pre-mRNA-processing factor 17 [Pelomyxa schiedti]|nr:pre-mRNA-processing factor 17 [Pelomyxa schiedti]
MLQIAAYGDDDEVGEEPGHNNEGNKTTNTSPATTTPTTASTSTTATTTPPAADPGTEVIETAAAAPLLADMKSKMCLPSLTPDVLDPAGRRAFTTSTQREVYYNPTADDLNTPQKGPLQPHRKTPLGFEKNVLCGFADDLCISQNAFNEQFHTFHSFGYASDPSGVGKIVGDKTQVAARGGQFIFDRPPKKAPKSASRAKGGNPGSGSYLGPWAPPASEVAANAKAAAAELAAASAADASADQAAASSSSSSSATEDSAATTAKNGESAAEGSGSGSAAEGGSGEDGTSTVLYLKGDRDYRGRTFISPPSDIKAGPHGCFLPKKRIHTWNAHAKGVSCVRLFPKFGHLMLSSGLDGQIKIWNVYESRQCVRAYLGHSKGVRDLCWNADGTRFLSCAYDRQIRCGKIPYCVRLHPEPAMQDQFLAGCSDKKIVQFDIRTRGIVLEYDQHLGAVNTVTFIDSNRRFVSSSDDKSLRIWEYGIPVPIKYISEPHMHSMPSVTVHPNGKWFVCQSLDNQILVYSARDRFKLNHKKRFIGHITAGYACQVNFSADGHYLISGDGEGKLWLWDWKSCRAYQHLQAHETVCIGCEWHPVEPSRVVTCGWDSKVHYWD